MDIKNVLQKVADGAMDIEEAEKLLRENPADRPYEEMGFAKLDTDRKERSGFAEVVYCQGKSDAFIGKIFKSSTTPTAKSSAPGLPIISMSW